jgi:N-formylglutamate amidohydrolase
MKERQTNREKPIRIDKDEFIHEVQIRLSELAQHEAKTTLVLNKIQFHKENLLDILKEISSLEAQSRGIRFYKDGFTDNLTIEIERLK